MAHNRFFVTVVQGLIDFCLKTAKKQLITQLGLQLSRDGGWMNGQHTLHHCKSSQVHQKHTLELSYNGTTVMNLS